ncbi:2-succinyl-6-hydroxy-2,4-cyclohexadiene-1-carboxylate synthase [compost metagenome]
MEKIIRTDSKEINIQWINPASLNGSKPILVFLHEALGSIVQWKSFPSDLCLALDLCGVVIERSGHGKSSNLTTERNIQYLHQYADETMEVLREILPPNQKYILVGHSDGGSIALIIASGKPKNLQAVVTMAAHTFVEDETLNGIYPAIEAFEAGKLDGLYRIHGEKTKTLFYAWAHTWLNPVFKNWDIRSEIHSITVPVFAMQGTDDQYGTEEQVNSIVRDHENRTGKMIPSCGHHPHLEKKEGIVREIEKWISGIK